MTRIVPLAFLLGLVGCLPMHPHDMPGMNDPEEQSDNEDDMMHMRKKSIWPTVRIEAPEGARVRMDRGVFGDGLDVMTPFQGSFQPTGWRKKSGYPLDVVLDSAHAHRYGIDHPVHLKGWLMVAETLHKQGILRIAPSECEMRALLAGDLVELKIDAEELPSPELVCRAAKAAKVEAREEGCRDHHHPMHAQSQQSWQGMWHSWMHMERGFRGGHEEVAVLVLRVAQE